MDKIERDRLRTLCEAATAGPWERQPYGGQWKDDESGTCAIIHKTGQVYSWGEEKKTICNGWMMNRADVDFIADARTALPAALDALDAMEECIASINESADREVAALRAKLDAAEARIADLEAERDAAIATMEMATRTTEEIRRATVEAIVRRLRDAAHRRSGGLMDGLFKAATLIEREFLTEKGGT